VKAMFIASINTRFVEALILCIADLMVSSI
jgi:hypothetical protein